MTYALVAIFWAACLLLFLDLCWRAPTREDLE